MRPILLTIFASVLATLWVVALVACLCTDEEDFGNGWFFSGIVMVLIFLCKGDRDMSPESIDAVPIAIPTIPESTDPRINALAVALTPFLDFIFGDEETHPCP